ncbi:MAG TPA: right-handed parallel beta-helix repeat-containing protein [Anaerolineales bacterium]|nr:right-handed parallel beta-helix repeat-containing protein [Anaerolineales bacterium]
MAEKTFAAFFSYVHADDEHDNGRLTAIRKWLEEEISAQTGESFEIFQDRDDIHWGHAWEERINSTLDSSTFLIAVVTPRYLRSAYCRKEFERFTEREKKLKRNDLILPMLYMDTPALSNKDDFVAFAISGRQYADWRSLRFEPWTNPDVTKRLAQLAKMICDAMTRETPFKPIFKVTDINSIKSNTAARESSVIKQLAETEKRNPAETVEPPLLVVDPMPQRGNFTSILKAIEAAQPGTRILIREGLYKEAIVLDKPLELIGDGEQGEIIIEAKAKNVINFKTEFGRVSNLTLRQTGGGEFYGVNISQGRLELQDCDITSLSLACVAIYDGADPRLRRNHIHNGQEGGVFIYDNGKGILEDNDIFNNDLGIAIETGSEPTIRRNQIHNNRQFGISIDNGEGTIEDNEIFSNGYSGILICNDANPLLRRNRIYGAKQNGILVDDDGKGTLEDNDIYDNSYAGIEVRNGGSPALRDNHINNNNQSGIYIHDNGSGLFEGNDLRGNRNPWSIDESSKNNLKLLDNIEE